MMALCCVVTACGDGDHPTGPSASAGIDGQWSGTTAQGTPIAFTVSGNRVVAVTVGYSFGGCSGSRAFSDVNAEIVDLRNSPGVPPTGPPYYFGTLLGPYSESDNTMIQGFLSLDKTANGFIGFTYPCGSALALWTATKR